MSIFNVAVVIPGLTAAVEDLNHADSPFDKSSGHEAGVVELAFAVKFTGGFGFTGNIKGFLSFGLHAKGDFHGLNTGFELIVPSTLLGMHAIELVDEIQLLALSRGSQVIVLDMINNLLRVESSDVTTLENAREETIAPELRTDNGFTGTEDYEAGKVLIL